MKKYKNINNNIKVKYIIGIYILLLLNIFFRSIQNQ